MRWGRDLNHLKLLTAAYKVPPFTLDVVVCACVAQNVLVRGTTAKTPPLLQHPVIVALLDDFDSDEGVLLLKAGHRFSRTAQQVELVRPVAGRLPFFFVFVVVYWCTYLIELYTYLQSCCRTWTSFLAGSPARPTTPWSGQKTRQRLLTSHLATSPLTSWMA